jgi:trimethylamine:corrinoid methyltransferase-like protein
LPNTPEKWVAAGKPTIYTRAREKVEEIPATPLVDPLPKPVCAELDAILRRADQELAD